MATKLVGHDDVAASGGCLANYLALWKFAAEASGTMTEFRFRGVATGNAKLGLYADNSGSPGALLVAVTASVASGTNTASCSPVSITQGTVYWLAVLDDAGSAVGYKTETAVEKYKSFDYSNALPNPAGTGYADATTVNCILSGWQGVTDVTVNAPAATAGSAAPAPAVQISAASSPPVATVSSQALAPIVSVGTNVTVNAPVAIVTSQAYAPSVTAVRNVISSPPTATAGSQAYTVIAGPFTGVTVSAPCALASSQAFTVSTTVLFHVIWEASYEIDIPQVNRAFVVGEDLAGSQVTGIAITQEEVDLVGERLEVQHTPAATTADVAADVAVAVLAKNRLDGQKARILIPPHCALELWDVVNVVDAGADQSGNYRVSGYSLVYDVQAGQYQQQLDLSAV